MQILAEPAFKDREQNPYTWLLYTHMTALDVEVDEFSVQRLFQKNYKIWHRHWPERNLNDTNFIKAIAKTLAFFLLMRFAQARGTKIVWTVHNLGAHERLYPKIEAWFWKVFTHQLDGYISLSQSAMDAAQKRFPALQKLPGFIVPLGHFQGEYPDHLSSQEARTVLEIPDGTKVALFFGKIRPYKNVPQLIRVFRELADPTAILYIVGFSGSTDLTEEIKREAALDSRVKIHLDFVPKDKAQIYFRAADIVLLPYQEILNSASALLALSFSRPILVPLRGSLGELQAQVGQEWVHTYTEEITTEEIEQALDWALNTPRSEKAPISAFDWQEIAQRTLEGYKVIAAK